MNDFLNTNLGKTLRWVLVLPSALIGFFIPIIIVAIITVFISPFSPSDNYWWGWDVSVIIEFIQQIFTAFFSSFFGGFCFIKAGVFVAPKFKKTVSLILGLVLGLIVLWKILGWGLMLTFAPTYFLEPMTWRTIVSFSSLGLGAFFAIRNIYTGEDDFLEEFLG